MTVFFPEKDACDSQYSELYLILLPDLCIGGMENSGECTHTDQNDFGDTVFHSQGLWSLGATPVFWSCLFCKGHLEARKKLVLSGKQDSGAVHLHTHPPTTYTHSHTYTSVNHIFKSSLSYLLLP